MDEGIIKDLYQTGVCVPYRDRRRLWFLEKLTSARRTITAALKQSSPKAAAIPILSAALPISWGAMIPPRAEIAVRIDMPSAEPLVYWPASAMQVG